MILNPNAGGGTALQKWGRLAPAMKQRFGDFCLLRVRDEASARTQICSALALGEDRLVAAGGDGTVNMVAGTIVGFQSGTTDSHVKLGAIGLGSSNDYHKPLENRQEFGGVPCKLDFTTVIDHDVCTLQYSREPGQTHTRSWLINASVGTTASANRHFNDPDWLLRHLKHKWTNGAIIYAAMRSIIGYRSREMSLTIDGHTIRTHIKNLAVVKNPHFSGDLWYDSPYEPGSGSFYVHLLPRVPPWSLLKTLWGLTQGKFSDRKVGKSWRAQTVHVSCNQPFFVECDGEVVEATDAVFTVRPRLLKTCTS